MGFRFLEHPAFVYYWAGRRYIYTCLRELYVFANHAPGQIGDGWAV
jgi:hypothetical protein